MVKCDLCGKEIKLSFSSLDLEWGTIKMEFNSEITFYTTCKKCFKTVSYLLSIGEKK